MNNHLQSHVSTFACHCGKKFNHKRNLTVHQKRCLKKDVSFICRQCNAYFRTVQDLNSHTDDKHPQAGGRAPIPAENISLSDQPSTSKTQGENKDPPTDVEKRSALNDTVQEITIQPRNGAEKFDLLRFYSASKSKSNRFSKNARKSIATSSFI